MLLLGCGQHAFAHELVVDPHSRRATPAAVVTAAVFVAYEGSVTELARGLGPGSRRDEVDVEEIAFAGGLELLVRVEKKAAKDRAQNAKCVLLLSTAVDVPSAQAIPGPPTA